MASQRDKDYHKLRNPDKYEGLKRGDVFSRHTKEGAEANARYKKIWSKYGLKSMVGDKRRRNSTRKSNQKNKQVLHQIERAHYKSNLRAHLVNQDYPINTQSKNGSIN